MMIRSGVKVLLGAMLSASAAVSATAAGSPASAGQPAVWQSYDILVHLTGLPRPYSCDELWYKFRGVLVSLGAGRIDEVLPTDCGSSSPSIHVRFFLPRLVRGSAAAASAIVAAPGIVDLAPGHPTHLEATDCHLVRQMRESLLTDLPVKVQSAQFACLSDAAPENSPVAATAAHTHASREHYALRVQVLLPQWPEQAAAPAVGQGS
ncbi:MAG: hypothetical protein KGJ68_01035 [Gammaproteobacteria bacterium]|nr:hypothetical protein [Gammaproteobacteria bacterium]